MRVRGLNEGERVERGAPRAVSRCPSTKNFALDASTPDFSKVLTSPNRAIEIHTSEFVDEWFYSRRITRNNHIYPYVCTIYALGSLPGKIWISQRLLFHVEKSVFPMFIGIRRFF